MRPQTAVCWLLATGIGTFSGGFCETSRAVGKRVADAQHAALAMEHGCTWVTRDADFRDFEPAGLRLEILEPDKAK